MLHTNITIVLIVINFHNKTNKIINTINSIQQYSSIIKVIMNYYIKQ